MRILMACLLALVGAAAIWTAVGFGKSPSSPSAHTASAPMAPATALGTIGALRQARDPQADNVASNVANEALLADQPADLQSARLVKASGRKVWLASSSDGRAVCQITAGAVICPPAASIEQDEVSPAIVTRADEPVHVSGITSDAVGRVVVIRSDGTSLAVDVSDNYFAVDLSEIPRELQWTGSTGPRKFAFPPMS